MKQSKSLIKAVLFVIFFGVIFAACGMYVGPSAYDRGYWNYLSIDKTFPDKSSRQFVDAIVDGNYKKADKLLHQGVHIDVKGRDGVTPLLFAIMNKEYKAYTYLIDRNANIDAVFVEPYSTKHHFTAMEIVVDYAPIKYLRYALEKGVSPNHTFYNKRTTLIFEAIDAHDIEKVELLAKYGADLNYYRWFDINPLNESITGRQYKFTLKLLEFEANPLLKIDTTGMDPNRSIFTRKSLSALEWTSSQLIRFKKGDFRFLFYGEEKWFKRLINKFIEMGYLDKEGNVLVEPIFVKWSEVIHE